MTGSFVCAWCPGFVPGPGASHGICPACIARFDAGERSVSPAVLARLIDAEPAAAPPVAPPAAPDAVLVADARRLEELYQRARLAARAPWRFRAIV